MDDEERKPWESAGRDVFLVTVFGLIAWLLAMGFALNVYFVWLFLILGMMVGGCLASTADTLKKREIEEDERRGNLVRERNTGRHP